MIRSGNIKDYVGDKVLTAYSTHLVQNELIEELAKQYKSLGRKLAKQVARDIAENCDVELTLTNVVDNPNPKIAIRIRVWRELKKGGEIK